MSPSMSTAESDRLRLYADEVSVVGGLRSARLRHVLSQVPRTAFLPPGPWMIERLDGSYYSSGDADPGWVLHSVGVALDPMRGLNNANPGNVSRLIEAADPRPGNRVLHVGAGSGYYSALLAEMVGETGLVIASEIDPDLRASAASNLSRWSQVRLAGDATRLNDLADLDLVFCSGGVAAVPPVWLRALKVGGRMVLPLTGSIQGGPIFLLERLEDLDRFSVKMLSAQRYFPCLGTRGQAAEAAVDAAISRTNPQEVTHLSLAPHAPDEKCWLHDEGCCLRRE